MFLFRQQAANAAAAGAAPVSAAEQLSLLISQRRSIFPRDFTGEPVDRSKLEAMLEAANWAPTHKKTEPWRFVVLGGESKAAFEDLTIRLCGERLEGDKREATLAKLTRKKDKDWRNVYCYIAICLHRSADKLPEWEELAAVAAAVQNLWLTGSTLGVAGYWSSWQEAAREAPEMHSFLGLGDGDRCLGVFVTGVADAERAAAYKGSRKSWQDKVEWRL